MKKIILISLLFLFVIVSCERNKKEDKSKIISAKSKKDWVEIINWGKDDIPYFLEFSFSKINNAIYAPLKTDNSNLNKRFIKINISDKLSEEKFNLLGFPGQCPECTDYVSDLSVEDGFVIIGMFGRGYNFYNLDGDFLFQIFSPTAPAGKSFLLDDKLVVLPTLSNYIKDYAVYIFNVQSKKVLDKLFFKDSFLRQFNFLTETKLVNNRNKLVSLRNLIISFQYTLLKNGKIAIFTKYYKAKNNVVILDVEKASLNPISLEVYCRYISTKTKKASAWGCITGKNGNMVLVRLLGMGEREVVKRKYPFLLFEIDEKGNLVNIYSPPQGSIPCTPTVFANVIAIDYTGKDEFIAREFVFFNDNRGKTKSVIDHIVRFKARKLNQKELKWILERLR